MKLARILLAVSVMGGGLAGCATTGGGMSPVEEVLATMKAYAVAMKANDVDAVVAFFSEDWESDDGATKEVLQDWFQGQADDGIYDDIEIILTDTEVSVDGDTATMGPVGYETPGGTTEYEYEMKKESDGVWRCVYSGAI